MPVIRLNTVDLPAPLGPIIATIEPASIEKSSLSTRDQAAETLRDALELQQRHQGDASRVERLARRQRGVLRRAQFGAALAARNQTLGPEEHRHHEDDAVDQEARVRQSRPARRGRA